MSVNIILIDDDETTIFIHETLMKASNLLADPISFRGSITTLNYLDNQYEAGTIADFLLLLDLNMPEVDGWGFLDIIHKKPYASRLSIIVVTSSIDTADRRRAMAYDQVIEHIEKPLDINRFNQLVQQFINQKGEQQ